MSERQIKRACLLLALAAVFACVCGLPLIWDGSYQLVVSLREQRPFFYLTRFHSWFLWWPCVWLSRVTDNLTALLLAYGLPFLAAPAASLWLAWRIVRKHRPELAVWAAFGVAVAPLPGQVFVINDSVWQQTIFWPLFLSMLVPLSSRGKIAFVVFAFFQLPHQVGVLLLGIALAAGLVLAKYDAAGRKERRWQIAAVAVFFFLAAAKAAWVGNPRWSGALFDTYAAQQASLSLALQMFFDGVWGLPFAGIVFAWIAAVLLVARARPLLVCAALALAALAWVLWALTPPAWAGAINNRRWVVPLAVPFYACALFEAARPCVPPQPWRGGVSPALAAVFALVIVTQSLEWHGSVRRLMAAVQSGSQPVVTSAEVPWIRHTPIDHWGATTLVMAVEGKIPKHYFAYDEACRTALFGHPAQIALWSQLLVAPEPGPAGYYDHRPLLRQMKAGTKPLQP